MMSRFLPVVLTSVLLAALASGQVVSPPDSVDLAYAHSSGPCVNLGDDPVSVAQHVLTMPGAPSMRAIFGTVILGDDDWIEVKGVQDGYVHLAGRH